MPCPFCVVFIPEYLDDLNTETKRGTIILIQSPDNIYTLCRKNVFMYKKCSLEFSKTISHLKQTVIRALDLIEMVQLCCKRHAYDKPMEFVV